MLTLFEKYLLQLLKQKQKHFYLMYTWIGFTASTAWSLSAVIWPDGVPNEMNFVFSWAWIQTVKLFPEFFIY